MSDLQPDISTRWRISPLWVIPMAALVGGIWMLVQAYLAQGPVITIEFADADGLVAGKTKVRLLNLDVGVVESIALKPDMSGIIATVNLQPEVAAMLRKDTDFWIVKARIGAGGVSGLGTILSGAYISMSPGLNGAEARVFQALDAPPLTPAGAPGLRLTLTSDHASVGVGDQVLYRGLKAGRVESSRFDAEQGLVRYDIFVDAPFDKVISSSTRFWDVSGLSVDASAEGFHLNVAALDSLMFGGVSFERLPDLPAGEPVTDGTEFALYDSFPAILKEPFTHGIYYVTAFRQSVSGLVPGAPVEFRGLQIGRVERVMLKELTQRGISASDNAIPVLLFLEPGRLDEPDTDASVERLRVGMETAVATGLRASLQTGSLLTGRKKVSLEFYPDQPAATIGSFQEYPVIPSIETGVGLLEHQIGTLLAKLNALPLDETVVTAKRTLESANSALNSLNVILSSDSTRALPANIDAALRDMQNVLDGLSEDSDLYQNLNASMETLRSTLDNLNQLTRSLSEQPNALVFPSKPNPDPVPEARQ